MRIAIQLFGHLRSYKHTKNALYKNIIDYNRKYGIEFDIFIHTWNEMDSINSASYVKDKLFEGKKVEESELDRLQTFYKAKDVKTTDQLELTQEDKFLCREENVEEDTLHRTKNLSYSVKTANDLRKNYEKKHNIHYDFVLLTRPDILFLEPLDLYSLVNGTVLNGYIGKEGFSKTILSSYIILSDVHTCTVLDKDVYICGIDLLFISSPEVASKISSWHENIEHYLGLYPELAITKIIKDNNFIHHYIAYEKDKYWMILRNDFHYYFMEHFSWLRFLSDCIYMLLLPILLFSIKFRRISFLNPHYIKKEDKLIDRLVNYYLMPYSLANALLKIGSLFNKFKHFLKSIFVKGLVK